MSKTPGQKMRKSPRFDVMLPVEFRSKQQLVSAEVANIGTGGMCVKTANVLPVKSQSFFKIVTKDSPIQYNVEGEVIWSKPQSRIRQRRARRPGMMGVRFVQSRFFTAEMIDGIVDNVQHESP